jgi:hypothetical protein
MGARTHVPIAPLAHLRMRSELEEQPLARETLEDVQDVGRDQEVEFSFRWLGYLPCLKHHRNT